MSDDVNPLLLPRIVGKRGTWSLGPNSKSPILKPKSPSTSLSLQSPSNTKNPSPLQRRLIGPSGKEQDKGPVANGKKREVLEKGKSLLVWYEGGDGGLWWDVENVRESLTFKAQHHCLYCQRRWLSHFIIIWVCLYKSLSHNMCSYKWWSHTLINSLIITHLYFIYYVLMYYQWYFSNFPITFPEPTLFLS